MPALTRGSLRASLIIRSSAVRVPPIAAVAGRRTSVGNAKLAAHSKAGAGSAPSRGGNARPAPGRSQMLAKPHSPITASSAAYMLRGDLAHRIGRSSAKAPSARPAKNPAIAPNTAIISVPSARLSSRVQTISYPRPAKPDAATIGISLQPELASSRSPSHDAMRFPLGVLQRGRSHDANSADIQIGVHHCNPSLENSHVFDSCCERQLYFTYEGFLSCGDDRPVIAAARASRPISRLSEVPIHRALSPLKFPEFRRPDRRLAPGHDAGRVQCWPMV